MKTPKSMLTKIVLKNLLRIRNVIGARQEDFADAMGIQRVDYNKRELGKTPLLVDEIGMLLDRYPSISLSDLIDGYEAPATPPSNRLLSEKSRLKFPYLEQIIIAANQISLGEYKEEDIEFLKSCLKYAINKLEK